MIDGKCQICQNAGCQISPSYGRAPDLVISTRQHGLYKLSKHKTRLTDEMAAILSESVELNCGLVLPNRLCKAAMAEMLGRAGGSNPTYKLLKLYEEWQKGDWGLILTGNVMVDPRFLGTPCDIIVPEDALEDAKTLKLWKNYAIACKGKDGRTPAIVQLNHTGRQSGRGMGRPRSEPSLGPSDQPLKLKGSEGWIASTMSSLAFNTPRAMTFDDIKLVIEQFKRAALLAHRSGFDGVQVHCSHGYLLSQFHSPDVNTRTDAYGGDNRGRSKLLHEIIDAIRSVTPSSFCVSVKLNSSDYVAGGMTEEDALEMTGWLAERGDVDLLEVSGGTYQNAEMLRDDNEQSERDARKQSVKKVEQDQGDGSIAKAGSKREAFFTEFAKRAKPTVEKLKPAHARLPMRIMVTGGFRTRPAIAGAIEDGACDIVGLGRPACVVPDLPRYMLDASLSDENARAPRYSVRGTFLIKLVPLNVIGPGINTLWHDLQLFRIAGGKKTVPQRNLVSLTTLL
ncbi:uncharacterized protein L969DRAFT_620986 [Mixia osmundae IAM 14324]|uniref:uncharacterized protein n=1 Tax=Mixia osmundae (strain CBS 9802 / IAM 14324 / JCM 22182 / KY 12970) TaxID=764103 RepID=UPI0004A54C94|nr:uncharacterized protein L969DRAFT_620986 [Mixia osmundae IAM 14324]KEI40337.1 hypothetical protein L969DRAFT_620986 [Mixia osmundae IAM 14324]